MPQRNWSNIPDLLRAMPAKVPESVMNLSESIYKMMRLLFGLAFGEML